MALKGKCACGAVSYSLPDAGKPYELSACHCETCRNWTGGILISISPTKSPTISGSDNLSIYKSSDFGERAFCKICGSSMYFKVVSKGVNENDTHFCAGTLQSSDYEHLQLTREVFVDSKPTAYALEGGKDRLTMTKAEYDATMSQGGKIT